MTQSIGFIFPGQGSQFVGMGQALVEASEPARDIFSKADEVLGFPLSKMIKEGPEDLLKSTENAQPAILTASVAAWEATQKALGLDLNGCFCAGHSLGEYSALVAAQVLDFETAITLVRKRGLLMQEAALACDGGMAAVMGKSEEEVQEMCRKADENYSIQVANLNSPGQIVVSGSKTALDAFAKIAVEEKAKVIPLAVSGPFHSSFMKRAAEGLAEELNRVNLKPAVMPIIANVSAKPISSAEEIRQSLIEQVTGSVRWEESMKTMASKGVEKLIEIGPGKVLRGLMKKIDRNMPVLGIFEPDEINSVGNILAAKV